MVISGEKEYLEDTNVDGNITIKWMLKKYMGGNRVGLSGSGCGQVMGTSEHDNKP